MTLKNITCCPGRQWFGLIDLYAMLQLMQHTDADDAGVITMLSCT